MIHSSLNPPYTHFYLNTGGLGVIDEIPGQTSGGRPTGQDHTVTGIGRPLDKQVT